MITDNTAKWQVKSLNTPIANSGDGKLPVGHIYISMGSSAPAGSLPLWGQLFSRSTYKDLWDWVNKHPEQLLSESEWQTKYIENNGLVPFYSEGTDSTNFRVPNCFNLGSDKMDYVVDEGKEGLNGWRLWKSGWIEQWGRYNGSTDGMVTIYFPKPFSSPPNVQLTRNTSVKGDPGTSGLDRRYGTANDITTTSFTAWGAWSSNFFPVWEAKGYAQEIPQTERVLWCVKAFGNIDEGTGSTSLDSIATNIAQLNTKVDGFASGLVDSHATAIAEMQSYFNFNMEETLLFDVYNKSAEWSGNIYFKDSYKNYDYLIIEFSSTYAVSGETYTTQPISVRQIVKNLEDRKAKGFTNYLYPIEFSYASWHWSFNTSTSTDLTWMRYANSGAYPRRVWGYKLKANGITNKSAIDVTQISNKISSLLTSDNHLRLPSGLEVW